MPPPDITPRTSPKVRLNALRYGPKRTTEYPWERDMRLMRKGHPRPFEDHARETDLKDNLYVTGIDLYLDRTLQEHHTDKFVLKKTESNESEPDLIVRRGQPFLICVNLNETFNRGKHDLQLSFSTGGDRPTPGDGTWVLLDVKDEYDKHRKTHGWRMYVIRSSNKSMVLEVTTPPTCTVGEWILSIFSTTLGTYVPAKRELRYEYPSDFIILFNPWNPPDQVYIDRVICPEDGVRGHTEPIDEYGFNDCGIIFIGREDKIIAKPWNFGQFDEDILKISLHLLRKAFNFQVTSQLSDPILVCRGLTKVINNVDGTGVMTGRYRGTFADGIRPTVWIGSPRILRMYSEQNGTPVKYGQPWVFSGVYTTVSKTFLLIDGRDFHVWNEVWMKRPDLPEKPDNLSGWQVLDPTPQEPSGRSEESEIVMRTALRSMKVQRLSETTEVAKQDIVMEILSDHAEMVGYDVYFTIKLTNISRQNEELTIGNLVITVSSHVYTGGDTTPLKKVVYSGLHLKYRQVLSYQLRVSPADYDLSLKPLLIFEVEATANVKETGGIVVASLDYSLTPPTVGIQTQSHCKLNEPTDVHLTLRNPFHDTWLTFCVVYIEGNLFGTYPPLPQPNIKPHDRWQMTLPVTANKSGTGTLFVSFDCKEIPGIFGVTKLQVYE
ncbi:protein-glutamine gamma-glutamyltransferase K-like [Ylistrum balloti]|uniref:protein-glutamine gamma-glutamyltransferase K-like n=1 Tax=Ylistrum balloti TaxID=509963 RepID=UPI002905AC48|nr:protein-glutamine gamma-glutamyltransferase K-like [Ylistrum balloti]